MKFPTWESQGGSGCRQSAGKDNRGLEVPSITSRAADALSNPSAADLGFLFLCLLIFVGVPVWMVIA